MGGPDENLSAVMMASGKVLGHCMCIANYMAAVEEIWVCRWLAGNWCKHLRSLCPNSLEGMLESWHVGRKH